MIVVFDSGIWISAMQFGGIPLEAVVRATAVDRFARLSYMEEEIVRILTRKFAWELNRIVADLSFYWADAIHVELQGTITGVSVIPTTRPFLSVRSVPVRLTW